MNWKTPKLKRPKGASMIEYGITLALISIASIGFVNAVGIQIDDMFDGANSTLHDANQHSLPEGVQNDFATLSPISDQFSDLVLAMGDEGYVYDFIEIPGGEQPATDYYLRATTGDGIPVAVCYGPDNSWSNRTCTSYSATDIGQLLIDSATPYLWVAADLNSTDQPIPGVDGAMRVEATLIADSEPFQTWDVAIHRDDQPVEIAIADTFGNLGAGATVTSTIEDSVKITVADRPTTDFTLSAVSANGTPIAVGYGPSTTWSEATHTAYSATTSEITVSRTAKYIWISVDYSDLNLPASGESSSATVTATSTVDENVTQQWIVSFQRF